MPVMTNKKFADRFIKEGYVILRNIFSPTECEQLKYDSKQLQGAAGLPRSGVKVWGANDIPSVFLPFILSAQLKSVLEEVADGPVELLSMKTVFKSNTVEFSSPWHQDRPYWGGNLKISIWISLDNATIENGCLKILPGTHQSLLKHEGYNEDIGFTNRLNITAKEEQMAQSVPLNSGDVLIFSDLLVHSSYPNTNGKDRWCMIPTYRRIGSDDQTVTIKGIWDNPRPLL